MRKKWSIGEITFDSKEGFRSGQRDLQRIKKLIAGVDLDNESEARELYRVLKGQPFLFESEVGAVFRSYLLDKAQGHEPLKASIGYFEEGRSRHGYPIKDRKKQGTEKNEKSKQKRESKQSRKSRNGRWKSSKRVKESSSFADRKKRRKLIFAAGAVFGLGMALFALYRIFSYDILSYISAKKMEALASCVLTPLEIEVSEEHRIADLIASGLYTEEEAKKKLQKEEEAKDSASKEERSVLYQYSVLYGRNSDMAGWIRIDDTVINYPVMLTPEEEEYYLKKGFDKKSDINGIPFMDIRCTIAEPVTNYLIYGHNMKNGSMFSSLLKYEEKDFYLAHPLIYFDTIYQAGVYEIVGVFRTAVAYVDEDVYRYYQFIQAENQEEYDEYIAYVKENSFYETGITAEYGTQLLTLSTCDRSVEDGRFVVVAREKRSDH